MSVGGDVILEPVKIALLGLGNVGSGAWQILQRSRDQIALRAGVPLEIGGILVRSIDKPRQVNPDPGLLTTDAYALLNDPTMPIVVETIGCPDGSTEPALSYILHALRAGKYVVTANKEVLAKHAKELSAALAQGRGGLYYEASVAGGIPIIKALRESLAANRVQALMGIINGTTNYMLTKMASEKSSFASVLAEAQARGYAEADPTSDVEGHDAAYKLAILSSIAFGVEIDIDDIYREGITRITPADLEYAQELGMVVKLLAIAKEEDGAIEARVHPTMIPVSHPLANVSDVFNAVFVQGDAVGDLMFYGRGAGSLPTGSAVVADCIDAARSLRSGVRLPLSVPLTRQAVLPIEDTVSRYYIHARVIDKPGVLAAIATVFGEADVSIESVIQKGHRQDPVSLVFVTHLTKERNVRSALSRICNLSVVREISNVIRVEGE
jgi:homoserine dehydrogenase